MKKILISLLLLFCIPSMNLAAGQIKRADVKNIILAIEKKLKDIKSDKDKAEIFKKEIKKIEESIYQSRSLLQKKKLNEAYYTMKIAEKYFDKMKAIESLDSIKKKYDKTKKELKNKKNNTNE